MTNQDRPEEQDGDSSSQALHNLLADLNMQPPTVQAPTWSFSATSRSNPPSPAPIVDHAAPAMSLPHRLSPRPPARSAANPENGSASQPSLFNSPSRSIFLSGPPTSSVSANTAQASMTALPPSGSTRPLSALTVPSSTAARRTVHYHADTTPLSIKRSRLTRAEKEVDDPSTAAEHASSLDRRSNTTPTALSRLFTAPETSAPSLSREPSYSRSHAGNSYTRASTETAPLPTHLYNRGLLSGRHSDITVHAFGTSYALHRILLDRAPFFASALSEPWFESSASAITLHPEEVDSNITQTAFELVLKRLYGCNAAIEEDEEAIGLFATGSWLEMADLIDSSVESLLRQMTPRKLASLIKLVTSNYYGKPGDRILASAKAMICREGWEMPYSYWDGISGDMVRELLGGDGFFVPGEWDRWHIAAKLLNRRLKAKAIEAGLVAPDGTFTRAPPETLNFFAVRFDTVYRRNSSFGGQHVSEKDAPWLALYTAPEIAPLLVLLDEGIHYVHLTFEQLQHIRAQRDLFGTPIVPEKVITTALWMSMELRQSIVNANESDLELGLSQMPEETDDDPAVENDNTNKSVGGDSTPSVDGKGKGVDRQYDDSEADQVVSDSWDGNGQPRKFWIPNTDSTCVMGANPEAIMAAANGTRMTLTRHYNRLSATIDPQDVQWASDFASTATERPSTPARAATIPAPISYTHYPPFRFSAEFPHPRMLKEKKRVYSRTVWYAGSLWNVYIQKIETTKNTQLGVYLHRAKDRQSSGSEETVAELLGSVDERIGHLERQMLLRRNERRSRRQQQPDSENDTSGSGGDPDATLVNNGQQSTNRPTGLSGLLRGDNIRKASQTPGTSNLSSLPDRSLGRVSWDSDEEDDTPENCGYKIPALPPYVDGRPTIKTYFKIYSPSKSGRMLSVYESAPDKFNFSQSWGWKSSTIILDDGLLGGEEGSRPKNGRLRFMIVIGNV